MITKEFLEEIYRRISSYNSNPLVDSGAISEDEWDNLTKVLLNPHRAYAEIVASEWLDKNRISEDAREDINEPYLTSEVQWVIDNLMHGKGSKSVDQCCQEYITDFADDVYGLPSSIELPAEGIDEYDGDKDEAIADYLSREYEYCVKGFNYQYLNDKHEEYKIYNIIWDI